MILNLEFSRVKIHLFSCHPSLVFRPIQVLWSLRFFLCTKKSSFSCTLEIPQIEKSKKLHFVDFLLFLFFCVLFFFAINLSLTQILARTAPLSLSISNRNNPLADSEIQRESFSVFVCHPIKDEAKLHSRKVSCAFPLFWFLFREKIFFASQWLIGKLKTEEKI